MENKPNIRFKGFTDAWEQRKLGDIIKVCNGKDYKHLEIGKIPVYGTGGYMLSVSEALSYKDDSIGIGRKGTIDRPYILKAPFWTVDTLFYCIPKQNNDLKFIFSVFQNIDWKSMDESTGVPSLSKAAINKVNILTPNILEQVKIGTYFSTLDHLITLHQRKCDETKKLKKFMLQKMFPKNGEKNPEIRFAGFTDDWEQRKVEDIMSCVTDYVAAGSFADIKNNVTYLTEPDYAQLVRTVDLKKKFANTDYVFVDKNAFDYLWRVNLNEDCIVLPNIGANIGEVYYVEPSELPQENNVLGPNAILLKTEEEKYFIFTSLTTDDFQRQLFENVGSSGQPKFNKTELKNISLWLPSVEEQKKIGDTLRNLDHLITLHQRKCDKLKLIKKFKLQNMFPKKG